ncbi:hypothetical protein [Hymenobacter sp.]|jgi:carbonic anhydrase|uniref:hypothetical protein n=1 Tax=Hymenobacter sp. TaxID=1898978 RepID=UPI002ED99F29
MDCTSIRNTVIKENRYDTKAEKTSEKLIRNSSEKFAFLTIDKQKELLVRLTIYRQAYELLDAAFIGNKVNDEVISVSGLIYDQKDSRFERLILELYSLNP